MLTIIVLSAILTSTINLTAEAKNLDKSCDIHYDRKTIDGPYYEIWPFEIDYSKNDLYFTVYEERRMMIRLNIQTGLSVTLPIPDTLFKAAVDDRKGIVYIPTRHGIYTYNTTTNTTDELLPNTANISTGYLELKDNNLYYTEKLYDNLEYSQNYTLFKYDLVNRKPAERVEEFQNIFIHKYVIDVDGDITFTNMSGLYTWKKQNNRFESYYRTGTDATFKRTYVLFYDRYNNIYSHTDNGIYIVDKNAMKLKKVLFDVPPGFGLAIDKYNYTIYSDYNYVYKAIPTKYCKCKLA